MEPVNQSYIPKKTFSPTVLAPRRSETNNFFGVISFALLALSLIALAGAFAINYWIYSDIYSPCGESGRCGLQESLKHDRESLGFSNLERAKRIEVKTTRGQALIDSHVNVVAIFKQVLNPLTIDNVGYTNFKFDQKGLTISGVAKSYQDVAYQAKVFAGDQAKDKISTYNFYDLDLDQLGNVIFKLDLSIDPIVINFQKQTNL
ncbi:MAG: hypothetical protein COX02_00510 [Candidatus Vogelbacteria bacterium CG22_combo_CG10-13_8_21_14_all_37_9]|uniref:Uncharacterized protein n=1 Tax=Candidatus Vogelbacteria bacterium CG22_combo_CG10-13_8_21_14_all_37_9 TaxID=1975046 RepID=A0A2H0BL39_9BACT|nr:MAG: hypothetical protein COX02_00510 [Candidatus Vogelbacteria bacterium CG22_combo_CG10-13_8_21_14_all_37_9]